MFFIGIYGKKKGKREGKSPGMGGREEKKNCPLLPQCMSINDLQTRTAETKEKGEREKANFSSQRF